MIRMLSFSSPLVRCNAIRAALVPAVLGATLLLFAASGAQFLESLTPDLPKKQDDGYSLDGTVQKFQNSFLKVEVEYLSPERRAEFYSSRKLEDPFRDFSTIENLVPIRARFENLQKSGTIFMSPNTVVLGNIPVFDDTKLYQTLYLKGGAERRLEIAGATLFIKPLELPPGTWIERIFLFQYDDPIPVKRTSLIIQSILGQAEWDLEFKFKAKFGKEKG